MKCFECGADIDEYHIINGNLKPVGTTQIVCRVGHHMHVTRIEDGRLVNHYFYRRDLAKKDYKKWAKKHPQK